MPEPLVHINDLVKTYQTPAGPLGVLQGIDMEIGRGEFIALVGPSGGGKSTFLNMLTGIDRPTSGMVVVDGVDVSTTSERKLTRWRARNIGIVFQGRKTIKPPSACPLRRGCRQHMLQAEGRRLAECVAIVNVRRTVASC